MDMSHTGAPAGRTSTPLAPGISLTAGTTLNGRYQIEAAVGVSLFGDDYRARDLADGRTVSLKLLYPALVGSNKVQTKLLSEIQAATKVEHKNVAQTIGVFDAQLGGATTLYVVSEHIDGQTLCEMLDKKRLAGKPFSLKGTYSVVTHLCNALEALGPKLSGGGLTPSSVWISTSGRIKLSDVGLSRALGGPEVHPSVRAQMAAYGAPELGTAQADQRTDLFSLGAILFEMLTSRSLKEVYESPSLLRPGLPAALDAVVGTCLVEAPEGRYANPKALKEALHSAVAHEIESDEPSRTRSAVVAAQPKPSAPAVASRPAVPTAPLPPTTSVARPPAAPPPPAASATGAAPPTGGPPPAAAPTSETKRVQRAGIKTSFNMDVALSAIDESTERWLIQKDKLDFGPFNLRDIKEQIEAGKIVADHIIIDTENGERRRVKDHPQLRDLIIEAERAQAERSREAAEADERRRHKRRVVALLGATFVVVVGVLGGGFLYGKSHHWFEQKVIKEVVHDKDYDFMKGVEISLKVDPPQKAASHGGKRHHSGKPGEFDDTTNLGDASEGGGDETLDQAVVQRVMSQNFRVLVGCIGEERQRNPSLHNVEMDFIIRGTGNVSAVKVNGQTGTPIATCMYGKMQSVTFPKFNGQKTHASFSLALK